MDGVQVFIWEEAARDLKQFWAGITIEHTLVKFSSIDLFVLCLLLAPLQR